MADQATLNGGSRVRIGAPFVDGVLSNLAGFGSDLASLAELQAELGFVDLKEATQRASVPLAVALGSAALLLGSLPVLLLGIAEALVTVFHMQRVWALLATAVATMVLAAVLALVTLPRLKASMAVFRRSREELTRNLAWVKTVLAQSGRYTPQHRG